MSNLKDKLKSKVRTSAHVQLIDPTEKMEDDDNQNKNIQTRKKKIKFEESHTRQTLYIENNLLKRLNKLSEHEKGEKTRIINEALRRYLNTDAY